MSHGSIVEVQNIEPGHAVFLPHTWLVNRSEDGRAIRLLDAHGNVRAEAFFVMETQDWSFTTYDQLSMPSETREGVRALSALNILFKKFHEEIVSSFSS